MSQTVTKALLVEPTGAPSAQTPILLALHEADGTPKTLPDQVAAQADTTAADLAALKVDFNALLAKFRAAGVMDT